MKRHIICAIIALLAVVAKAEPLKFLGVPIGSDKSQFIAMLDSKGFVTNPYIESPDDQTLIYTGEFAGEERVVTLTVDPLTDEVTMVMVMLEIDCDLSTAKSIFEQYKQKLSDKYESTSLTSEDLGTVDDEGSYSLVVIDTDTEAVSGVISLGYLEDDDVPGSYMVILGYTQYNEGDFATDPISEDL